MTTDNNFAEACAAMDDSTGVYLYAPKPSLPSSDTNITKSNNNGDRRSRHLSFECRQFPRSSGYAEDPATGIAAAALAASLQFGDGSFSDTKNDENMTAKQ